MARFTRPRGMVAAFILSLSAAIGPAAAANPQDGAAHSIAVTDANGFVAVSEVITPQGAIIDTFQSGGTTVKVLGSAGSSVSFYPTGPTDNQNGGLGIAMSTPGSKAKADPMAYRNSGRTVVGDLVTLGVPRADAERLFGQMETPGGTNPNVAQGGSRQSAPQAILAAVRQPSMQPQAVLASPTTVWDTQCITASAESGKLYGYGCSTFYIAHQDGGNWWLATKYLFSAHSTDTSLFPKRLKKVGWKAQWVSGNQVTKWRPSSTTFIENSCFPIGYNISVYGVGYGISTEICPDKHGIWELSSLKSGALWEGAERGTDWEAAEGLQEVHSPAGAPATHSSYATWTY
jgi:hypothetical protein